MGPIGEAIVPQWAVREGAAVVRLITPVDESIISHFWALITVIEPPWSSHRSLRVVVYFPPNHPRYTSWISRMGGPDGNIR